MNNVSIRLETELWSLTSSLNSGTVHPDRGKVLEVRYTRELGRLKQRCHFIANADVSLNLIDEPWRDWYCMTRVRLCSCSQPYLRIPSSVVNHSSGSTIITRSKKSEHTRAASSPAMLDVIHEMRKQPYVARYH